jgi:hypothetical protein
MKRRAHSRFPGVCLCNPAEQVFTPRGADLSAHGTNRQGSAYQATMQRVGTLSWSGTGWGAATARSHSLDAAYERPRVREECASAAAAGPVSRAARVEVRLLEQDWSQIVRRCMDGDSGAWAEMVRTHHQRVYGLCYRFTGNGADAEDLTQDVFVKIYMNLASFDSARGSLAVWITTMTRNLLVDNFRRTRNQRATGSLDEGWEQAGELSPLRPIDRLTSAGPHGASEARLGINCGCSSCLLRDAVGNFVNPIYAEPRGLHELPFFVG